MDFSVESLETPALTKAQLADLLFEQIGLNKRESKDMIDAYFDLIVDSLTVNENVANSYNGPTFIRSTNAAGSGILNANALGAMPTGTRSAVTMDDSGPGSEDTQGQSPRCGD